MNAEKLTWEEIKQRYDKEWVELVDYDWPEENPYPHSGVVRVHAPTRKEFYKLANEGELPSEGAIFFVGKIAMTDGVIRNKFYKIIACE